MSNATEQKHENYRRKINDKTDPEDLSLPNEREV
jgi:hypothetical protein